MNPLASLAKNIIKHAWQPILLLLLILKC